MQQVCIHVGLTRKQNREGRGERWYGGCSSRAASLGRRNSSWPVFLVVLADVRWFRPWTGWRWTRSPVRYLCGRKEWESGSASYIRCCNMSRLPDDDDVWDIAVLRASPVFMQIAPLGWWWWGITAAVNMIMLIKSSNVTIYRFFLFILSFGYVSASAWLFERYKDTKTFSPLKADNIFYYLFFFKFGGNLTSRWYLHSPPSGRRSTRRGRW